MSLIHGLCWLVLVMVWVFSGVETHRVIPLDLITF